MNGDQAMRAHSATLPAPTFRDLAWVTPPPLAASTVAIVTSAALHTPDDEAFSAADTGFRFIPRERRDLVLGHWSPNFDRTGVALDLNVVYPSTGSRSSLRRAPSGRWHRATCRSPATSPTTSPRCGSTRAHVPPPPCAPMASTW